MAVQEYDIIFLTNIPAFYKINLYEAIGQQARVLVIFLAAESKCRTADFYQKAITVDTLFLSEGVLEGRSLLQNGSNLLKVLKTVRTNLLVVGGWDAPEYWLALYLANAQKRALALESSCFESKPEGFKGFLKRLFVSKLDWAFPSGKPHAVLLKQLGFKGRLEYTQGVGIFHYTSGAMITRPFQGRLLYVGRLAPEKNISLLIQVVNQLPDMTLSIVGDGPLALSLQAEAGPSIQFLGHVPNEQLASIYQMHDIFVLPSYREPWGLVVEEALYQGLPVVVSSCVGCVEDWVIPHQLGLVFDPLKPETLRQALLQMADRAVFQSFKERVQGFDFTERDRQQQACYLNALGDTY